MAYAAKDKCVYLENKTCEIGAITGFKMLGAEKQITSEETERESISKSLDPNETS